MGKIKVLMSSTVPMQRNGITNVMMNLYRNLDHNIFEVEFISIDFPCVEVMTEVKSNGSKVRIINRTIRHALKFINDYRSACKGFDIVHIHGNSATISLELIAAKLAKVPIRIAHSHNTFCTAKLADKLLRPLFYLLCNGRLACGQRAGEWLFRNRDFTIIANGINTDRFIFNSAKRSLVRSELGWEEAIVVGHIGNFVDAKNHDFLIDVFNTLHERDRRYRLLLVGDGNLQNIIKDKVYKLHLQDKICFAGSVSDVTPFLSAIDLIVMPSLYEGVPLTLIEEQASGLPCIVSDTISDEVNKTDLVKFVSLESGVAFWANEVLNLEFNDDRTRASISAIEKIKKSGFDIIEQSEKLKNYYLQLIERD